MKWLLVKRAVGAKRSKGNLGLECFATNSIPRAISHIFSINIMINRGCTLSVIEVKSFWIQIGLIQLKLRVDLIWGCPFWRIGLARIGLYIYGEILGKWQTKSNWIVYFLKFGWFFHDKMVAPYHHRRMIYSSAYSHGSVKTLTFARKGNIVLV